MVAFSDRAGVVNVNLLGCELHDFIAWPSLGSDALWHPCTLAARQGCVLLPVSLGGDLGWKLDAVSGWALGRGSRDVGRETGGCRGGSASGGLDNELMGCGLQDVGDLAVLQKNARYDLQCGSLLKTLAGSSDLTQEQNQAINDLALFFFYARRMAGGLAETSD